jgi:CBS domain-containing protein
MAQKVREVMTGPPHTLHPQQTLTDAAHIMRDQGVGSVLVIADETLKGLVTDRDIVVRGIAKGLDPNNTPVAEIVSADPITVGADDDADTAVQRMREAAVRRLPVVEDGRPVGILSIGDLAIERDEGSALADISAERPNT